jgi:purine-cytosine permease-like protein
MTKPSQHNTKPVEKKNPSVSPTRSVSKWTLIGFVAGSSIPIVFGLISMHTQAAHNAALPESERIACGMGEFGAMIIMAVGAPALGVMGATIGYGLSKRSR